MGHKDWYLFFEDVDSNTALHLACTMSNNNQQTRIVRILLDKGLSARSYVYAYNHLQCNHGTETLNVSVCLDFLVSVHIFIFFMNSNFDREEISVCSDFLLTYENLNVTRKSE